MKPKLETNSRLFRCSHCTKKFKYDSERKRHEISHVQSFKCEICSKYFNFISALRRHEKQHERTESVECSKCNRKFRDDTLLKRHIKYAHKGTYSCTKCNATFRSEAALSVHMKCHKPRSERQYQCSFNSCSKAFNFLHHLKHHELVHTNSKQHFCSVCGKGFIQSHHLKNHLKTHDPEDRLQCPIPNCNKKFVTEYARKRHLCRHKDKLNCGTTPDSKLLKDAADGTALCTTCGKIILKSKYVEHVADCTKIENAPVNLSITLPKDPQIKIEESLVANVTDAEVHNKVNDCKSALGSCIMGSENDNCLCSQMSIDEFDQYDFDSVDTLTRVPNISDTYNGSQNNNICEGCECAHTCTKDNLQTEECFKSRNTRTEKRNTVIEVKPEMEYRNDGIVKIKEIFDIDIPIIETPITKEIAGNRTNYVTNNDTKFVLYNSCKAVLGKCIVSGNGTIGEGCLCAKMAVDEQQIMEQEIDDITPHPKNY